MKLYNLYQEVILEQIKEKLTLFEGVSISDIDAVLGGDIDKPGKHYRVKIRYRKGNGEVSDRFIEINQRNITSAKNGVIDARVVSKDGVVVDPENEYRKFRLDRIESFEPTKVAYFKAAPKFKTDGTNNSKSIASVEKQADYNYQYAPSTLKQKEKQSNVVKPQQMKPIQQPEPPKTVRPMNRIQPKQQQLEPEIQDIDNEDNLEINK